MKNMVLLEESLTRRVKRRALTKVFISRRSKSIYFGCYLTRELLSECQGYHDYWGPFRETTVHLCEIFALIEESGQKTNRVYVHS
jgi:hypothetical protein